MALAIRVDVLFDENFAHVRDILFHASQLLQVVEGADEMLVTDEILAVAAELRATIDEGPHAR